MTNQPEPEMIRLDQTLYVNRLVEGLQGQLHEATQRAARFAALSDMLGTQLREVQDALAQATATDEDTGEDHV